MLAVELFRALLFEAVDTSGHFFTYSNRRAFVGSLPQTGFTNGPTTCSWRDPPRLGDGQFENGDGRAALVRLRLDLEPRSVCLWPTQPRGLRRSVKVRMPPRYRVFLRHFRSELWSGVRIRASCRCQSGSDEPSPIQLCYRAAALEELLGCRRDSACTNTPRWPFFGSDETARAWRRDE